MEYMPGTWYCGPWEGTLRDPAKPRRWDGLSRRDRERLVWFVRSLAVPIGELHTHVPVGRVPLCPSGMESRAMQAVLLGRWPLRIDAMICFGRRWWMVECKEAMNYSVVGQCLTYSYLLCRDRAECRPERVIGVVDRAEPDMVEVAEACGISVCVRKDEGAASAAPAGDGWVG